MINHGNPPVDLSTRQSAAPTFANYGRMWATNQRGVPTSECGHQAEQAFFSDAGYAVRRVCAVMVRISFSMLVHCTEFSFRK